MNLRISPCLAAPASTKPARTQSYSYGIGTGASHPGEKLVKCRRTPAVRRRGGGPAAGPDVIVSCGSGVTACHDALAIELAGLPPARLYVGSFSGWIVEDPRSARCNRTPSRGSRARHDPFPRFAPCRPPPGGDAHATSRIHRRRDLRPHPLPLRRPARGKKAGPARATSWRSSTSLRSSRRTATSRAATTAPSSRRCR